MLIGIASMLSVPVINLPKANALHCDLHINPYGGGVVECDGVPDELPRIFSNPLSWYGHSGVNNNNIFMLNPQPLPPVDCPMCGAVILDKSLFETNLEIKVSPQKDGSIILSTTNSTEPIHKYNVTNSKITTNQ